VFLGDGCLMEGISHEACSLACTLGLNKLIAFYDDNGISIDGEVRGWFTDDTPGRFEAYGWHVIRAVDGHDAAAVKQAIEAAREVTDRPVLICCKTIIGFGAPNKQGKESAHGSALGEAEVALARKQLGWNYAPFEIPAEYYAGWDARARGKAFEDNWNTLFAGYKKSYPELATEFERRLRGELPRDWTTHAEQFVKGVAQQGADIATRKASELALNGLAPALPELIGGSADLTGSNNTWWKGSRAISRQDFGGNYIFYGVREFGMSAMMNGIALHGGFIPYGGTFLTFSDYARNALRMASLMGVGSIFVYTHDSIGLGEDGPTHQSIEHLASLRLMPGMQLWRPCDDVETAVAWTVAIERRNGPTAFALSRQNLPHQPRVTAQVRDIRRGGYILLDTEGDPDAIIIATGSEIALAVAAARRLAEQDVTVRVVSMPCTSVFDVQDRDWQEYVLPQRVTARLAVEAGVTACWHRYVGGHGRIIGIDRYGESAPAKDLFEFFGFTVENVVRKLTAVIDKKPVRSEA
ncbi:MAG: transketolase, partial [Gammaproteobacteria bacterium]